MARNSSGTHSLPSGNPVVSGASISSTTHNSTMSDISSELTDSLSRSGKGAMLAPLELANGTVSVPALSFDSDTDTGIYRKGANNMALVAGGAEVLDVQAAGVDVTGALAVSSTLAVTGASTLTGAATVTGALSLTTGIATNVALTGANPTSSTAFTDTLTPTNIPKAWALLQTDGAGTAEVTSGFNAASASISGTAIRFTMASAMANTNYIVLLTSNDGAMSLGVTKISTTVFDITATATDFSTDTRAVAVLVFGAQ